MEDAEYKRLINETVEKIDNLYLLKAICELMIVIKDIKSVKVIYFLIDIVNSFKKKWGI